MNPPTIPGSLNLDNTYSREIKCVAISDSIATLYNGYLLNLNDPVGLRDAANKEYVTSSSVGSSVSNNTWKTSVKVATTTDISYPFNGIISIDDTLVEHNDRVLIKDQIDTTQNGVWIVNDSVDWERSEDCADGVQASGSGILVSAGSANSNKVYICNTVGAGPSYNPVNYGSAIDFVLYGQSSPGGINQQVQYNNSGVLDGDAKFTFTGTQVNLNSGISLNTNTISSNITTNTASMLINHNGNINIGSLTNNGSSINAMGRSGTLRINKKQLTTMGNIEIIGANSTTSGVISSNILLTPGNGGYTYMGNTVTVESTSATTGALIIGGGMAVGNLHTNLSNSNFIKSTIGTVTTLNVLSINPTNLRTTQATIGKLVINNSLVSPLTNNYIYIGDSSNKSTEVQISSDFTTSNTGLVTLATVNTSPTTTTLSTIVTNDKGLVISNTSASLASANIWVGNSSDVPTAVMLSGDITMSNTAVVTLATINPNPSTSTLSTIVTNEKGLVISNTSASLTSANLWIGNTSSVPTEVTFSSDMTLANTGAVTLATVNTSPTMSTLSTVTTNAKGLVISNTSASLTSANTWVGNDSSVPTEVTLSGDATMTNTGTVTLATTNLNPATTILSTVTTNAKGLVTSNTSASLASANIWVGNSSAVPTAVMLSGDITMSNTAVVTLATINANPSTSTLSTVVTNAKGFIISNTSASLNSANIWIGNASSVPTEVTFSSDMTLANTGAVTLATVNTNPTMSTLSTVTTNSKGLVTSNTSASLTSSNIWVGNNSSVPTEVTLSGDATMINTGTVTLATVNANPSTSTLSTIITNAKGLVTSNTSASLASANVWVGNSSAVPTEVTLSSDMTLANTGAVTLATVNTSPTRSTLSTIITNAKGLVTSNTSASLASARLWVGNASSVPTAVVLSSALTMSNTGAVTLATVNTSPTISTLSTIVTNSKGLVTSNSSASLASANFWVGSALSVPTAVTMSGDFTMNNAGVVTIANSGSALTKVDDTNILLTLGGSPNTALLRPVSITAGWSGILSGARGGTGVNNTGKIMTLGGSLTTVGAFNSTFTFTGPTNITFPTSGTLTTSIITSSAALTRIDDTNVTLTLGGSPSNALLQATSITAGWSGQLPVARGGTGLSTISSNSILYSSSNNNIQGFNIGASRILVTDTTGTPSLVPGAYTNGATIVGNTGPPLPTLITATTGIQVTAGAATLALDLPNSKPGRNMLYNGSFQVAQRGTSFNNIPPYDGFTAGGIYTLDRWYSFTANVASSTYTISQVAGATSGSYTARIQRTGSDSFTSCTFIQPLTRDMCVGMQGNYVTLSFTAAAGANYSEPNKKLYVYLNSGTNSSDVFQELYSSYNADINSFATLTTTSTRYTFSSLISGSSTLCSVTFQTENNGTSGANDYVDISNVQLEISPSVSNFQYVSYTQDLQRCQYFYQTILGAGGSAATATTAAFPINCIIPMRIVPTISCPSVITINDGTTNFSQSSFSITNNITNVNGGIVRINNFTGLTTFRPYNINNFTGFTNSYLTLDSEIVVYI